MKKRIYSYLIIFLLIQSSMIPCYSTKDIKILKMKSDPISHSTLDINYIYNLSKRLSDIIFTEYSEETGEIAKGRAFGTKGEHKAADILLENLTNLGLFAYKEQLENTEEFRDITHHIQTIDSYVMVNNENIHSYISPVWVKNEQNNFSLNYTYNYSNLRIIQSPLEAVMDIFQQKISKKVDPFVIFLEDKAFYPHHPFHQIPLFDNFYFSYYVIRILQSFPCLFYSRLFADFSDYCKAIVMYDFNKDTIDMNLLKPYNHMPVISINGSNGKKIIENIENSRLDFYLQQTWNTSVQSYNVIGQLKGTDPSKTIIIDSLYDSWWCQGAADSAIAMAMVLGIAKYYQDHNIIPPYTIKFIGFAGEEQGLYAGAKHYASTHKDEDICYMIDLNQIGFYQVDPLLSLNIIGNNVHSLWSIKTICEQSNYVKRVNSSRDLKFLWLKKGVVSNPNPFSITHPDCRSFIFLKDAGWKLHHRDGLNHTAGDVMEYFDPEDIKITGELVLKVLKYCIEN